MPFCAPQIVYSTSFLGQTSTISPSVLFTAGAEGLYRLTVSVRCNNTTSGNSVHSSSTFGNWTLGEIPNSTSWTTVLASGDTLNFGIDSLGPGTTTYDLYLSIEQLA
jgi:hypothetical protein